MLRKLIAKIYKWRVCKICKGFMIPVKNCFVLTDKWQNDYRCVKCGNYWSVKH